MSRTNREWSTCGAGWLMHRLPHWGSLHWLPGCHGATWRLGAETEVKAKYASNKLPIDLTLRLQDVARLSRALQNAHKLAASPPHLLSSDYSLNNESSPVCVCVCGRCRLCATCVCSMLKICAKNFKLSHTLWKMHFTPATAASAPVAACSPATKFNFKSCWARNPLPLSKLGILSYVSNWNFFEN